MTFYSIRLYIFEKPYRIVSLGESMPADRLRPDVVKYVFTVISAGMPSPSCTTLRHSLLQGHTVRFLLLLGVLLHLAAGSLCLRSRCTYLKSPVQAAAVCRINLRSSPLSCSALTLLYVTAICRPFSQTFSSSCSASAYDCCRASSG